MAKTHSAPNPDPAQPVKGGQTAGLLRRLTALVRPKSVRGMLILAAVALAIIGISVGATLTFVGGTPTPIRELATAFARLDAGDFREARRLAGGLLADGRLDYHEQGGAYYIVGAITLHEADEQINPSKRRLLHAVAARYLSEARARGVPQTRRPETLFLLGRALHDAGRHDRSIPILKEALAADPARGHEIQSLLAESYLNLKPPRLAEALEHHRLFLAAASLSPAQKQAAQLTECRILLAQRNFPSAAAAAEEISATSNLYPEAVVLRGKILLEQLRPESSQPAADPQQQAAQLLDELQRLSSREGVPPAIGAQAQFLIGLILQQQGQVTDAIAQFDRTRRTHLRQPEGLAATVILAAHRALTNPLEAAALYRKALSEAGSSESYENPWLPLDQFQRHVENNVDLLIREGRFAAALDLAGAVVPLFPRSVAVGRQVEAQRAWARKLEEQAATETIAQAAVTLAEARLHWRLAGHSGRELAELRRTTRFYLDDLAQAADDLRRGQGYEQAVDTYRDLLRQDPPRGQPEALVGLGESLLSLGETEAALPALNNCRDVYPKHPLAYRARLLVSLAWHEQGKFAEAKELLTDNLYSYSLAPQSNDWRDSLFALGNLLYCEGVRLESKSRQSGVDQPGPDVRKEGLALLEQSQAVLEDAVKTLTEAVQRYPQLRQSISARYHTAEAYRHMAKLPRKRLASATIETSKVLLMRQMQEQLQAAVGGYSSLITQLNELPEASREAVSATILRNCYFGQADALFDLERYEEAIESYSAATNRYQQDPEALEAYTQIACCYRRLDRPEEARATVEQARVVLQRIRPDADFTRTTRLARADWEEHLTWLKKL